MSVRPQDEMNLPVELNEQVLNLARQMWQAVMAEGSTPAQAEQKILELSRTLGREVLSQGLSGRDGAQRGR